MADARPYSAFINRDGVNVMQRNIWSQRPLARSQDLSSAAMETSGLRLLKGAARLFSRMELTFKELFIRFSKQEQVLDILRNVTTTPPDRVKKFSFKVSGGAYSKLFDGSEKTLSWDNILWINRSVSLPQ